MSFAADKRYGRGPKVVPSLFQPKPSADPYCFESDEDPSVKNSPIKQGAKKSKTNKKREKKPLTEKKLETKNPYSFIPTTRDEKRKNDGKNNKDQLHWTLSKELKKKGRSSQPKEKSLSDPPTMPTEKTKPPDKNPYDLSESEDENIETLSLKSGLSQPLDSLSLNHQQIVSQSSSQSTNHSSDCSQSSQSTSNRTKSSRSAASMSDTSQSVASIDEDQPSPSKRSRLVDIDIQERSLKFKPRPREESTSGDESEQELKLIKPMLKEKPKINLAKMEKDKNKKQLAKGSRTLLNSPKKNSSKYNYNARSWMQQEEDDDSQASSQDSDLPFDGAEQSDQSERVFLRRPLQKSKEEVYPTQIGDYITQKIKVPKEQKQLYKVVHNVRQAHECQDHGETVHLDDDLMFLLDGLSKNQPISGRYLSAISLAKKCSNSTFRMHLKAESSLQCVFDNLSDAVCDPRLALSTCIVMYMLCQDKLNMDLDRSGLLLLVQLLGFDTRVTLQTDQEQEEYNKSLDTVYSLYQSAIPDGEELIDKSDLSAGYLAMECLLILTSRRSGEWFKEELRETGAITTISSTIQNQTPRLITADYTLQPELKPEVCLSLRKICRSLRVLEHVTANNPANQNLLIQHDGGRFVQCSARLLSFCECALPYHKINIDSKSTSSGCLILQLLLGSLRLLVNLSQNSSRGCIAISAFSGLTDTLTSCILDTTSYVLSEQRFDVIVLSEGLLINLCEHSESCRTDILNNGCEKFTDLFYKHLQSAEQEEKHGLTDRQDSELEERILTSNEEDMNETITDVLHRAGKHMEHTIIASYSALLLGVIVQKSTEFAEMIRTCLTDSANEHYQLSSPEQESLGYTDLIQVLIKFLSFMKMTDAVSGNSSSSSVETVVRYLQEISTD